MKKIALVTGGARRIGKSIVLKLAREGYAVAIHCHNSLGDAEKLAANVEEIGSRAAIIQANLCDLRDVERIVPEAIQALGPLTLLVNNASAFKQDNLLTLGDETWDLHFAANLRAPSFLARDFAQQLPDGREGCIVNIIDQRVWKPTPYFFSYGLTKAALFAATHTMAQALAPRIRVNAVGPGPTLMGERQSEEDFARQNRAVPLGHGGSPEEIAEAVLYLAQARSVTGQMIAVDGGQHLAWETPDVIGIKE
ncbi:SDR family oxidoreductase [Microvirga sp. 2MCAF38]|uniref:SDR family oxidoreductase n=1 Tax=Microvirga sp. 2MCAF38 TaxID=3232989 RepID=UPI003F993957